MKTVSKEEKDAMISRARWYKRFFFYQKVGKAIGFVIIAVALPYPVGILCRVIAYLFNLGFNLF